jgi:hypothetical protein
MRGIKEIKYYNITEMAFMLGISEKSVRNKISNLRLKKDTTSGPRGHALYTYEQLELLRSDKRLKSFERDFSYEKLVYQHHQTPVVITYYIYESKMNNHG